MTIPINVAALIDQLQGNRQSQRDEPLIAKVETAIAALAELGGGVGSITAIAKNGVTIVNNASTLDFTGAGVNVVNLGGGTAQISIPGTINFDDEGTPVVAATEVNFVGAGVTCSNVGGVATVTIPGGGGAAIDFQDNGTPVTTSGTLNLVADSNIATMTDVGGDATLTVVLPFPIDVPSGGTGNVSFTSALLKGDGTNPITAAVAGTDYVAPGDLVTSGLTIAANSLAGNSTGAPAMEAISVDATLTLAAGSLGVANAISAIPVPVSEGGTGITGGNSGGVLGFTAAGVIASSVALTNHAIVLGGGAGATPTPLGSLGTTTTVLHGNAAGAPTFGAVSLTADVSGILPGASGGTNNGFMQFSGPTTALKTFTLPDANATILTSAAAVTVPQGGTGLTSGTSGGILGFTGATTMASSVLLTANALVLGGGAGATPVPLASLGTTTTVLHGNAAGAPTFGAVSLTADVSGLLPVSNGGTGLTTITANAVLIGNGTAPVQAVGPGVLGQIFRSTATSPGFTSNPQIGAPGLTGTLLFGGDTSGLITVTSQSNSGTFNFNLPTTAGAAGQFLTSQGGGSAAMTWSQPTLSTRQVFTSGTAATYNTPAGCRQIKVQFKGGGGGGNGTDTGGVSQLGAAGADTIFNAINAKGGNGGTNGAGGSGGTGGTGTASFRLAGAPGTASSSIVISATNQVAAGGVGGGNGGGRSSFTGAGSNGVANSGGGGSGGGLGSNTFVTFGTAALGGGGGEGEYAELIINAPAATYTYTVGGGGNGGAAGTGGTAGGNGGSGYIIVDEYY